MTEQSTQVREVTTVTTPTAERVVSQTRVVQPTVSNGSPQGNYETKKVIFRSYQIIWYILGVIEVLLGFRVILKILGANSSSGFTNFIYSLSNPLAMPFSGILGTSRGGSGTVIEWSTLIAMAVYAVVAWGLVELFQLIKPTSPQEVSATVDNQ